MKWITRERVKVDRVACPWLIQKFIDPEAEFVFLPADTYWSRVTNGIVYDIPNCELGHHGEDVSFDSILKKYRLNDSALQLLAGDRTCCRLAPIKSPSGWRRSALDCPRLQRTGAQRSRHPCSRIHRLRRPLCRMSAASSLWSRTVNVFSSRLAWLMKQFFYF
jgi:hypothetical protein